MVDLTRLQYFLTIADAGSVSAAAEQLQITQPALSRQLAVLEREVGAALFARNGRGVVLTAAGTSFARAAGALVAHASQVDSVARDLRAGRPGGLVVAAPHSTITQVIAPCLAELGPDDLIVTARIVPALTSAAAALSFADLVVNAGPPESGLRTTVIGSAPICAHVPPSHRWARTGAARADIAELAGEALILQTPDNLSRLILDTALAARGITTRRVAESELETIVQSLVASGHGIGILTEPPRFNTHAVHLWDQDEPLHVVMRASWRPSHFATQAIQQQVDRFAQRMGIATDAFTTSLSAGRRVS